MKYAFISSVGISAIVLIASCKDDNSRYVDPDNGHSLSLVKDESTGLMVEKSSDKPVYIYVDTKTNDTIFGATGKVINGKVFMLDGKYKYADMERGTESIKIKDGDYKEKVDKDGDIKIKSGDDKIKIDGKTGEVKRK